MLCADLLFFNYLVFVNFVFMKSLKDMTLEELWELFPVVLAPHDPQWKGWAENEMESLSKVLAGFSPLINHIGSTAVPGIVAKPIVDILVEIEPDIDWTRVKDVMEGAGYICMSNSAARMSFNKGYTVNGFAARVFHIHFHAVGDNDEICFRDYLIDNIETAREYEQLKLSLLPRFRNNRDGYTEAKSDFIRRVTDIALSIGAERMA